jgi:hypothetical protein
MTHYELDGPGIETAVEARYSSPVQSGPGAHTASYTRGTGSFPEAKRPGRDAEHPPSSIAEVKERVELYLYSPFVPSWPVLGQTVSKRGVRRQITMKVSNNKFYENPSSGSLVVTCGQTEVCTGLTKVTDAFRDYANVPKTYVVTSVTAVFAGCTSFLSLVLVGLVIQSYYFKSHARSQYRNSQKDHDDDDDDDDDDDKVIESRVLSE